MYIHCKVSYQHKHFQKEQKMDSYSYTISSSSSSSSSNFPPFSTYSQHEIKKTKPFLSSLHRVQRLPTKPMTKQPIAPLPPTPPKIYKVEPMNFKEVVQMLTSAPEFQSNSNSIPSFGSGSGSGSGSSSSTRRLQDVAPPPLDLSPVSLTRTGKNSSISNNNDDVFAAQWGEFLRPSETVVESRIACNGDLSTMTDQITQERTHVSSSRIPSENYFGSCSPLANFPLSPASFAWCSSILLSPGTLNSPNAVL